VGRKSILGSFVRGMERAAARSAADSRRRGQRAEAMQSRAFERELIRRERDAERDRVRERREAERAAIVEERDQAQRLKQDAKEAQLRAWQMECEEHQEREQEIERIANDSPEVEDRNQLFEELQQRREFEQDPFVAPTPRRSKRREVEVEAEAVEEIRVASARFTPRVRDYRMAQLAGTFVSLLGLGMGFSEMESVHSAALPFMGLGLGGVIIAQWLCSQARARQYADYMRGIEQGVHDRRRLALEELGHHDEERNRTALTKATAEYETATASAHARFVQDEAQRLDAIRELRDGQSARIREVLDGLFPLELPIPCKVKIRASSASTVALDIDVPEPTALPTNEAKLLANGKVSYKDKTEKRLHEQYLRLVTGSAIRHASEVMLNVPTCQAVELHVWRTLRDLSVGNMKRSRVIEATFDYATLAPMSMDAIDPSAALKHFRHRVNLDRGKDLRPLDEAEAK